MLFCVNHVFVFQHYTVGLQFSEHPTSGECVSSANADALANAVNAPFKDMLTDAATQKLGRTPTDSELPIMLPAGKSVMKMVISKLLMRITTQIKYASSSSSNTYGQC